jgi:hypothetical protein
MVPSNGFTLLRSKNTGKKKYLELNWLLKETVSRDGNSNNSSRSVLPKSWWHLRRTGGQTPEKIAPVWLLLQ